MFEEEYIEQLNANGEIENNFYIQPIIYCKIAFYDSKIFNDLINQTIEECKINETNIIFKSILESVDLPLDEKDP